MFRVRRCGDNMSGSVLLILFSVAASAGLPARDSAECSPFGIHDPGFPSPQNDIAAAGARWVRYAGGDGIVWDAVERRPGEFDWTRNDWLYLATARLGVRMFVSTISANRAYGVEHGRLPGDTAAYLRFIRQAVERYDGDGVDDAPGSPVVDVWQVENEPDIFWRDSPQSYALLLAQSGRVIREANPRARVAIAGVGTPEGFGGRRDFYSPVFAELDRLRGGSQDRYFDIFDFHWYPFSYCYDYMIEPPEPLPGGRRINFTDYVRDIRLRLGQHGYADAPIFVTETAQYDGTPLPSRSFPPGPERRPLPFHSELSQAAFLVKMYVSSLAAGIDKVFWVTLTEWHNFGGDTNGVFDHVGLVNNPANVGLSHRKLAYYAYRKLADILEGSDWHQVTTVRDSGGVRVFEFRKRGKPVWVAWNDGTGEKPLVLSDFTAGRVKVTEAVPDCRSGRDVTDYQAAFRTRELVPSAGEVRLVLAEVPVFIEAE